MLNTSTETNICRQYISKNRKCTSFFTASIATNICASSNGASVVTHSAQSTKYPSLTNDTSITSAKNNDGCSIPSETHCDIDNDCPCQFIDASPVAMYYGLVIYTLPLEVQFDKGLEPTEIKKLMWENIGEESVYVGSCKRNTVIEAWVEY